MEENKTVEPENKVEPKKRKFNIIDLIVILILVAGVLFVGYKFYGSMKTGESFSEEYVITYYGDEVPSYVVDRVNIGDNVQDETNNTNIGTVIDKQISDAATFATDANGQLHPSAKEGFNSIKMTTVVSAEKFSNGVIIQGNKYGIGHTMTIRAGLTKMYLRVYDIQLKSNTDYKD